MARLAAGVLALVGLLAVAGPALADETLAAAAEREKARRAAQQADPKAEPAKAYTDEDLEALNKDDSKGGKASGRSAAKARQAAEPAQEPPAEDDPAPALRERVAAQRQEVAARQGSIKALEDRIAELRYERSRPTRLTETNRDQSINREIVEATAKLEEAKRDLADAEAVLEEIVEEARRAGVPYSQLE